MLSAERREKAKELWDEVFEKIYPQMESAFTPDSEMLIVLDISELKAWDINGVEYKMQPVERS